MRRRFGGFRDHRTGFENHPGKHEPLISYQTFSRVQEVLDGKQPTPARKDLNKDFPLSGFVNCGCCERPLTAAWSKSRNGTLHPYYLCHTKGCEMRGKSLRRADVEGGFEDVLKGLRPRQPLMDVATAMFKDAWEMRRQSVKAASESIRASIIAITSKIDKLMDRLVDAEGDGMISAYEAKLRKLQHEKRLSADLVSRVTDAVLEEVSDWQNRALEPMYPIVFLDALWVKIRDAESRQVKNKAVYVVLGVTPEGEREVLGLWIAANEGAKFWLSVMN